MKSFATADFWKTYAELSPEMQGQARKAYQLWQENSLHPSLHFKKVGKNLWSAREGRRQEERPGSSASCPLPSAFCLF
jgi:hypothetical protein